MSATFNINILNPGRKKKGYQASFKILWIFLPIITWVAVSGGLYFYLYLPASRELTGQEDNLKILNQEIVNLDKTIGDLEQQKRLYQMADGERIDWSSKLVSFSLMIPKGLWINNLIFAKNDKPDDKSGVLDIYGQIVSTSHQESLDKIAEFINKVNEAGSFRLEFLPLEFIYSQLKDDRNKPDDKTRTMDFKLSSLAKGCEQIKGESP